MRILLIRHAMAGDAEDFARTGLDDALRPLSPEGREQMRIAAVGLSRIAPRIDLLVTSPLLRARQTAEIVAAAFGLSGAEESALLAPDAEREPLRDWLRGVEAGRIVALVGHRPHLHELAGWLLTGKPRAVVKIRKGGALLLNLGSRRIGPGGAKLLWALAPEHLEMLGG
jgi:phosphohistidine phosphatase